MNNQFHSPFLKELVSDTYAFFWETYNGRPVISESTAKRLQPYAGVRQLQEVDSRPPYVVLRCSRKRYYAPLRKKPVLHRTFCEVTGAGKIVEFVSKYGLLGFTRFRKTSKRGGGQGGIVLVESVERWTREQEEMKRIVYLWELVKNERLSLLGALVSREDSGIYIILGRRKNLVAEAGSPLERKWEIEGAQPLEAAQQYLTNYINGKITGNVSPRMLPQYKKRVYLTPGNLLSAMWLMLLWEVIGEVRPGKCPVCGDWFDPKRSTRRTCSDRCRKQRSREGIRNRKKPAV